MSVDVEQILRPVDHPLPPFPPKLVMLASGEPMVVRQVGRDDIPDILPHVEPLIHHERDFYDIVAVRVYAELLGYYATACRTSTSWWRRSTANWRPIVNGRIVNADVGMSLHTIALRRGLRVGAHAFASKMEYHLDILGQKEVLVVAESPIGFRRWMIEYNLEKRFEVPHELGGCPSYSLTKELFDQRPRQPHRRHAARSPQDAAQEGQGRDPPADRSAQAVARLPCRHARQVRLDRQPSSSAALDIRRERLAMRDVYVIGIGITSFGRLDYPLVEIAAYPGVQRHAGRRARKSGPRLRFQHGRRARNHQTGAGQRRRRSPVPAAGGRRDHRERPGLGRLGHQGRLHGRRPPACSTPCLVAGAESMSEVNNLDATDFVASLTHPLAEAIYGVTLPALAGMFTRLYMEKYGVTSRHLAMVAVKNHDNAMHNPFAHVHNRITLEGILDSPDASTNNPMIADPLRFFDICPVSDGGAAVILASAEVAKKLGQAADQARRRRPGDRHPRGPRPRRTRPSSRGAARGRSRRFEHGRSQARRT